MSISELSPGAGPVRVLADALEAFRETAETLWSGRTDEELVETVGLVAELASVLAVVEAGAVVEADARDLATDQLSYGSTGDWLTHVAGLRRGEGKQRLVRATALTGPLERTRHALVDGTVSPAQADVVVRAVADLPPQDWTRRRGERLMIRHAASLDATELARAGRHLVEVVDPDTVDRRLEAALEREERAAHLDRYLAITHDRAGGVRITGRGTAEDGALIKTALMPLTRPTPTTDPTTDTDTDPDTDPASSPDPGTGEPRAQVADPRDHGARLWDALVATAQHALDTRLPPETHATPARLLVTLDHHTLKDCGWGSGSPPTAPSSHPESCAGSRVTPRSSPPSSDHTQRSSTSADSAAWSPPPCGQPS